MVRLSMTGSCLRDGHSSRRMEPSESAIRLSTVRRLCICALMQDDGSTDTDVSFKRVGMYLLNVRRRVLVEVKTGGEGRPIRALIGQTVVGLTICLFTR